jgi:hypothetical protein
MRWIKYIWILLVIYIACSARTCNEDEEVTDQQKEEYTMNLLSNVKNVFTTDSLSDHLLRAYEITAMEKLVDFTDYMKIVSDTSLDIRFRQHVAGLVRELFLSDEIEIAYLSELGTFSGHKTLEEILLNNLANGNTYRIEPFQIKITRPLCCINDSVFTGTISFNYRFIPLDDQDTSKTYSAKLITDIYLIKKLRSFGEGRIKIWDICLGDIKQYPSDL